MRAFSSRESLLVVRIVRHVGAGEPRRRSLGEISGDLHLAGERKHVGREPPVEQDVLGDLVLGGESLGLVEERRETLQHREKAGTEA